MEPLSPLHCFSATICCDHCIRLILTVTESTTFTMLSRAINIFLVELSLDRKMIRSTDMISRFGIYEMIRLGHETFTADHAKTPFTVPGGHISYISLNAS